MGKYKKVIFCFLITVLILATGWKLYDSYFGQKTIKAYTADQAQTYMNYENYVNESYTDSDSCYETNKFTEEQLFGDSGVMIIYGQVKEKKSVVCQAENKGGEEGKCNAYLAKLEIRNSIYGNLKQKKEYWVFVGVKHTSDSLTEDDEGIFIIQDEPKTLWFTDLKKRIRTCGMIYRNLDYSYLLAKENQGLEELKNKKAVINYWEKHGFLAESDTANENNKLQSTSV